MNKLKLSLIINLLLAIPNNLIAMEGEKEEKPTTEIEGKEKESKWQFSEDTRFKQQTFYNRVIATYPERIIEPLRTDKGEILLDKSGNWILNSVPRGEAILNYTIWLFDPEKILSLKNWYKLGYKPLKLSDLTKEEAEKPIIKYLKEYSENPNYAQTEALRTWKENPYLQIKREIEKREEEIEQGKEPEKIPISYGQKSQEEIWETIIYHSLDAEVNKQLFNFGYLSVETTKKDTKIYTVLIPSVIQIETGGPMGAGAFTEKIFGVLSIKIEEILPGRFKIFHRTFEKVAVELTKEQKEFFNRSLVPFSS